MSTFVPSLGIRTTTPRMLSKTNMRKMEPVQSRKSYAGRIQATSLQEKEVAFEPLWDPPSTFDVYYKPQCERD